MLIRFSKLFAIIFALSLAYSWADKKENCLKRCKRSVGEKEYAAIIDGGSSGSRIRVYEWKSIRNNPAVALPDLQEIHSKKSEPGVSDYADKPTELVAHLKDLIDSALEHIPQDVRSTTDLYFMATAGMRLLLEDKANDMVEKIDKHLSDPSFHPLRYLSPDNSRILSGEEEGVFAWIAVNYLKKTFSQKNVRAKKTYGILELGGASTQIAFAPSGNILADKFPVHIAGVNYQLYVHSYLYYGQNYVDLWLKTALYKNYTDARMYEPFPNPCMVRDDVQTKELNVTNYGKKIVEFKGSGNAEQCREALSEFVYHYPEDWKCNPKPCAIGTVYQPTIKPTMEFVAVGAFIHAFTKLKVLSSSGQFSYPRTRDAVNKFCSLSKDEVMKDYKPDVEAFTSLPCLIGNYAPLLFVRGYKFREDTKQIFVKKDIDGKDAEWTLGAILYEYEKHPRKCDDCQCPYSASSSPPEVINTSALFLLLSSFLSSYLFW